MVDTVDPVKAVNAVDTVGWGQPSNLGSAGILIGILSGAGWWGIWEHWVRGVGFGSSERYIRYSVTVQGYRKGGKQEIIVVIYTAETLVSWIQLIQLI